MSITGWCSQRQINLNMLLIHSLYCSFCNNQEKKKKKNMGNDGGEEFFGFTAACPVWEVGFIGTMFHHHT